MVARNLACSQEHHGKDRDTFKEMPDQLRLPGAAHVRSILNAGHVGFSRTLGCESQMVESVSCVSGAS
jgi:hypothetical protein